MDAKNDMNQNSEDYAKNNQNRRYREKVRNDIDNQKINADAEIKQDRSNRKNAKNVKQNVKQNIVDNAKNKNNQNRSSTENDLNIASNQNNIEEKPKNQSETVNGMHGMPKEPK